MSVATGYAILAEHEKRAEFNLATEALFRMQCKLAGASFLFATVLLLAMAAITPGVGFLVDRADTLNTAAQVQAMWENATLSHISGALSVLLTLSFLLPMYIIRESLNRKTVGDLVVRFGVLLLFVSAALSIGGIGLGHMIVHAGTHGETTGLSEDARLSSSWTMHLALSGLFMAVGYVRNIALSCIAFGLSGRLMRGPLKIISILVGIGSLAQLAMLLYSEYSHDASTVLQIAQGVSGVFLIVWYIALGVSLLKDGSQLVAALSEE